MKQLLLTIATLLFLTCSYCQDVDAFYRDQQSKKQDEEKTNISPDSIAHKSGFILKVDQQLKIGVGTMPDGSFKYIRINSASMMGYFGNNPNSANSANALPPSFSGRFSEISKLQRRGNKKFGYQDYAIVKLGAMARYEIDIDNAILSGEISLPEQFKQKATHTITTVKEAPLSIADELTKLKKLLDDGILTKEEFDIEKKKLLNKKDN